MNLWTTSIIIWKIEFKTTHGTAKTMQSSLWIGLRCESLILKILLESGLYSEVLSSELVANWVGFHYCICVLISAGIKCNLILYIHFFFELLQGSFQISCWIALYSAGKSVCNWILKSYCMVYRYMYACICSAPNTQRVRKLASTYSVLEQARSNLPACFTLICGVCFLCVTVNTKFINVCEGFSCDHL